MNPAPELTSEGPDLWQTTMLFEANYPYFQGHFPGQPILPAVVILGLSLELLKSLQNCERWALKNSKFTRPILPDQLLRVHIERRNLDLKTEYKVIWSLDNAGKSENCAEIIYLTTVS